MSLKVAYFQPVILAIDEIPPVEYSKMFNLTEQFHLHTELNDVGDPSISARGGQQIQIYPNTLQHDVSWLVAYLETLCTGYMELVTAQSGAEELKLCRPIVTSIWTIRQTAGNYQEMHSHPNGNISGNIYITVPDLNEGSNSSDCQILFRMPQSKDITKFVMNDTWKYTPKAGTIIMFPSYLPHTVYPWEGSGHRTTIAFDAILRPKE
jgi:hypothetical protein